MEHAKKLVLSVDGVSRFGTTPNLGQEHAQNIQQQMDSVLSNKELDEDIKLSRYNQLLYNYLAQRDALKEPVTFNIHDKNEEQLNNFANQHQKPRDILTSAVDYFQKIYR